MDLQQALDKIEIHEALARYARGVDTHDWELWKSVFTPDAFVDYTDGDWVSGSRDEVAAALAESFAKIPWAMHYVGNVEIDLAGDRATVRASFLNPYQLTRFEKPSVLGGYYLHDFVRTAEGWKSERLVEKHHWRIDGGGE